jgi:hypothetical protein
VLKAAIKQVVQHKGEAFTVKEVAAKFREQPQSAYPMLLASRPASRLHPLVPPALVRHPHALNNGTLMNSSAASSCSHTVSKRDCCMFSYRRMYTYSASTRCVQSHCCNYAVYICSLPLLSAFAVNARW